jgi:phage terminase large subunit GpA-like protein
MPKAGPGYVHFPREPWADDEYFAQLTAEKLVTKMRGSRPYSEWVQTRPRNEALDCLLLALVARRLPLARHRPGSQAPAPTIRRIRGSFVNAYRKT